MREGIDPQLRSYRIRIFALTWLVYAGFYLCRKNFSVVMPMMSADLGYTKDQWAWMLTGNLAIYTLGQFANGLLSDRFGPRLVVGVGLLVAVLTNVFMGFGLGGLLFLGILHLVNGYAQSTGWSGTVKNMTTWYRHEERGVVMAWWATCYSVGGIIATAFATFIATQEFLLPALGWRRGFWAPAALLSVVAVLYILFTRNRPSDAGFQDFPEETPGADEEVAVADEDTAAAWKAVLSSPEIWISGAMYFFLKPIRYAFLLWLPYYLVEALDYEFAGAGYTSTTFEAAGFFGVVMAGYMSDKLMGSRRFSVSCIMLLGLAGALLLYPWLVPMGHWFIVGGLCLIGAMTFGPDALMSGAGAMDIGSQKAAGLASGFINGMGSLGATLSPLIVAVVSESRYGWNGVFYLFVAFALIGAALMATRWNYGAKTAE